MELKVSCRFIGNLQPTNSNVKLLQCYGIFLISLNLICTKVKNTPQPCDDPAHQRKLQEILHTQMRDQAGTLASPRLMLKHKTELYFPLPHKWSIIVRLEQPSGKNRITQEPVHQFVSQINLLGPTWHKSPPEVTWEHT